MQVSWIDADRIKALVAQIAPMETSPVESSAVLELDTTPEKLPASAAEAWGFAMDRPERPARPAAAALLPEAVPDEPEPLPELRSEVHEEGPVLPPSTAAVALPLSRIRDKLRAIRQHAADAGILTRVGDAVPQEPILNGKKTVVAPGLQEKWESSTRGDLPEEAVTDESPERAGMALQRPRFEIPPGPRSTRLAAFAGWARQVLQEDGGQMLVMSDDGEVLWGGEAKAGLVLSTMMAWGAALRANATSACAPPPLIHQPLASGNVLTVIPCETTIGIVHAAVAAPAGLSHEQAGAIRGALCTAMN
ncbi:hypothetical protein [Prosthecobacter fluviatilis]|uniref:Roadblock/LAMTOR2 domain-containing protein n=1 Tax=Prosthecobacter fluviatilis TaxID=445931 RepID=A0ABW0KN33_9BACT